MRFLPVLGLVAMTALPAAALDLDAMSDDERAAFGEAVKSYLMENPQVIMDAVAVLQEREQQAQEQADISLVSDNAADIFDDGFSWIGGNPDGDITLVEFLDYRCGYCKRAHDEVAKLIESDGNIRLIVKEFPILGPQSLVASQYAIATRQVAGDDAYKALHDALMTFSGDISLVSLNRIAGSLSLDASAIEAKMDSDDVMVEIRKTRELAQRMNITGTPTFVLEDELLRGYLPYDQMEVIVADKRG